MKDFLLRWDFFYTFLQGSPNPQNYELAPQVPENNYQCSPSSLKINSHYPQIPKTPGAPCADPGFFVRGVQVNLTKKLWQRFFWSTAYFTEVKWLIFLKKTIIFQGSRGGPTFSRGGGGFQLFPVGGGVQLLIPYRTHITFDLPGGGGVRTPCRPSGSALGPHLQFYQWPGFYLVLVLRDWWMHGWVDK